MLGFVGGELVMPFGMLGVLWLAVLWQVVRGIRTGRMTEFRRTPIDGARPLRDYDRRTKSIQFRLLLGFYVVVLIVIPLMLVAATTQQSAESRENPPGDGGPPAAAVTSSVASPPSPGTLGVSPIPPTE